MATGVSQIMMTPYSMAEAYDSKATMRAAGGLRYATIMILGS